MDLDFSQLMQLIYSGITLVGMLLLYRSVPREFVNEYLKRSDEAAARTPNRIDDAIAGLQRKGAEALEKLGVLKVTESTTTTTVTPPAIDDSEAPLAG